jgi:hypothetical protein
MDKCDDGRSRCCWERLKAAIFCCIYNLANHAPYFSQLLKVHHHTTFVVCIKKQFSGCPIHPFSAFHTFYPNSFFIIDGRMQKRRVFSLNLMRLSLNSFTHTRCRRRENDCAIEEVKVKVASSSAAFSMDDIHS